jgi:hypothetical protein
MENRNQMNLLDGIKKEEAGVSLLKELQDAPEESGEYTESEQWRPEPGEGIEGVVVETYSFQGKFKDFKTGEFPTIPGWVLKVDGDDTLWSVAGLHGVLRQEMDKANAQTGDRVAVLYTGKRPTKDGSGEYHHYRLAIRHGNGPAPAQRSGELHNQHEPNKTATAKRKPGQGKTANDEPDF